MKFAYIYIYIYIHICIYKQDLAQYNIQRLIYNKIQATNESILNFIFKALFNSNWDGQVKLEKKSHFKLLLSNSKPNIYKSNSC